MKDLTKKYLAISMIIAAIAVVLGAFGAHALKANVTEHYLGVFQTANRYHFIHALGMMVSIFILDQYASQKQIKILFSLFAGGLIFFSAALYLLSIADLLGAPQLKMMGAIAPIGGLSFIAAWSYAAYLLLSHK